MTRSCVIKKIANLFSGFPETATAGNVHVGFPCESVPGIPGAVHALVGSGIVTVALSNNPLFVAFWAPRLIVILVFAGCVGSSFGNAPPTRLLPDALHPEFEHPKNAIWLAVGTPDNGIGIAGSEMKPR